MHNKHPAWIVRGKKRGKIEGNCLDDGRWFPDLHISCGQEFLFKGNVRIVEGGKVSSEKSSNIISFHISCGKEFLYKGNVRRSPKYFLCTGIPYYRKYGRRRCNYFFQKSPFLPPLFPHFLWTGIPDHRKWEDWEHTWAVLPVQAPGKDWTACPILILAAKLGLAKSLVNLMTERKSAWKVWNLCLYDEFTAKVLTKFSFGLETFRLETQFSTIFCTWHHNGLNQRKEGTIVKTGEL